MRTLATTQQEFVTDFSSIEHILIVTVIIIITIFCLFVMTSMSFWWKLSSQITFIMCNYGFSPPLDKYPRTAVPNLFGTRDWLRGKHSFHELGGGDGLGGNVSDGEMGSGGWSFTRSPVPVCGPVLGTPAREPEVMSCHGTLLHNKK